MKYLVIGAGGTGGFIAGYLALQNKNVTAVARGNHLKAIQNEGLKLNLPDTSQLVKLDAKSQDEIVDKYDVIFVTVKSYSFEAILPLLKKASNASTILIPIQNSMHAGDLLRSSLPGLCILDGCIYISGFISAPGEINLMSKVFRILFGPNGRTPENLEKVSTVLKDLEDAGITAKYSEYIQGEIFHKIAFTSAFAAVAGYYGLTARDLQSENMYRATFVKLTKELQMMADKANFGIEMDLLEDNLKILSWIHPDFTASFQKDLAAGHQDERNELFFDIVRLAEQLKVEIPTYRKIADHFGYEVN